MNGYYARRRVLGLGFGFWKGETEYRVGMDGSRTLGAGRRRAGVSVAASLKRASRDGI